MSAFEIIGEFHEVEIIAIGGKIRDLERLRNLYGSGRWRKLKGVARIRLTDDGYECMAELHWYESHGIGRRELKIKELLD